MSRSIMTLLMVYKNERICSWCRPIMKYYSRVSGHLLKIKELRPGIKEAILECDYLKQPITIENVKNLYFKRHGKQIHSNKWSQMLYIPYRGRNWTFLNEIEYHNSCHYISFKFGSDELLNSKNTYLKNAFF